MRKLFSLLILTTAIAFVATDSKAFTPSLVAVNDTLIGQAYSSDSDFSSKAKAQKQGARTRSFCPPGQAKKSGKGSAFNC